MLLRHLIQTYGRPLEEVVGELAPHVRDRVRTQIAEDRRDTFFKQNERDEHTHPSTSKP